MHWTPDGERVLSCSPDKSVRAWDAATGQQVKKMSEHTDIVNSCCPLRRGPPLLVSGGDDGTARVWDLRAKRAVKTLTERYQLLSVAFSDGGDAVYTAGIENVVHVWDLRREEVSLTLKGHGDSITGMRVSPDGTHLLTNSMDNTLRVWDLRPYAPANRCTKVFASHLHNFEKNLLRCDWSPDAAKVRARVCLRACCQSSPALIGGSWVPTAPLLASLPPARAGHRRQRRSLCVRVGRGHAQPHVQAAGAQWQRERGAEAGGG